MRYEEVQQEIEEKVTPKLWKKYEDLYLMRLHSAMCLDYYDARDNIHKVLPKTSRTVETMESCTAGMVASLLTELSGASKYFEAGYITYSEDAKINAGVSRKVIEEFSVYSPECACSMAKAITDAFTFGIGVTGVAGPKKEGKIKPGTVWIAISDGIGTEVNKYVFLGDRYRVRKMAAMRAVVDFNKFLGIYFSD